MKKKFGLSEDVIRKILFVILNHANVEKVIIYGSRAMGNYRENSDIDLTIVAPLLSLSDLLRIENEIDDLLLPYKIDLSLMHQIDNQDLIEHIKRVGLEFKI